MRSVTSIILIICACGLWSCRKPGSSGGYTAHMGGVRNWHSNDTMMIHRSITPDSAYYLDTVSTLDRSFALKIVDGNTIAMYNYEYVYKKTDSANASYIFPATTFPYGGGITYYYLKDSIVFSYRDFSVSEDQMNYYYTY